MSRTLLGHAILLLTLAAPRSHPLAKPLVARTGSLTVTAAPLTMAAVLLTATAAPLTMAAAPQPRPQGNYSFWLDARGLPAEQVAVVASRFAAIALEGSRLAPAARPESADLILRIVVGAAAMDLGAPTAQIASGVEEVESAAVGVLEPRAPTVEVDISLVDILDDDVLFERRASCELPLTRGRVVAAACLRNSFGRIVELMEEWAATDAAASEATRSFGPSEAERAALGGVDLAHASYREGVRAVGAGFEERGLELMADAQPLFKEAGLRRDELATWQYLAYLTAATSRPLERAIAYADEAVRIARELSDTVAEARALNLLAACEARAGNHARAASVAGSATRLARAGGGDPLAEGMSMAVIAGLAALRGDFDQARELQDEALALVRASGSERAETRLLLSIAVVTARDDDDLMSATLRQLETVYDRIGSSDLALLRDATFVRGDTRYGVEDFDLVTAGETDTIRALKLANRIGDRAGEAAAVGVLGLFAMRLGKLPVALDYLAVARERSRAAGLIEGLTDSTQLVAELTPDLDDGISMLVDVVDSYVRRDDLRGQIKSLSDLSRLQAGRERTSEAWSSYQRALAALDAHIARRRANEESEDIWASFTTILKSFVASRTELPYLAHYRRLNHMLPLPNPSWIEEAGAVAAPRDRSDGNDVGTAVATLPMYAATAAVEHVQTRTDTEAFLRTATVAGGQVVAGGITRPQRVDLEKDGVSRRALFKNAEVRYRSRIRSGAEIQAGFRDSWKYEIAAYELDKLLGLDMVPATVVRRIGDSEGALIDWVDGVLPEYGAPLASFDLAAWQDEVARVWLFDYLAYNIDRIPENLLIIAGFRIKLIDHSRAFHRFLVPMRPLSRFPRDAIERLRRAPEADLRRLFAAQLSNDEIDAFLERRRRVLARVDELLASRPEAEVLF